MVSNLSTLVRCLNNIIVNNNPTQGLQISNNSEVAIPIGTEIDIIATTGNIMVLPVAGPAGSSVQLYKSGNNQAQSSLMVPQPYGRAKLLKIATDKWHLSGDVTF